MLALLISTCGVCGVKSVSLMTNSDHLLFIFDLIWVMIARCSRNSNPIFLHIKYERVLTHKSATHEDFISPVKFLYSKAVLVRLMSVEILTWVPFYLDFRIVYRIRVEVQNRKAHKVEEGTFSEMIFIVLKTNGVRWLLNPFPFAIVGGVL